MIAGMSFAGASQMMLLMVTRLNVPTPVPIGPRRRAPSLSITVVIFCWHILLISESMDHHDSEIMDDRSID